jgi:voltage-gated potassium channel
VPEDVHLIRGSATDPEVIAKAKPAGAEHVLVTAETDGDVLVSAVLLRRQAPDVPMTALTNSNTVRDALEALGVQQTMSVDNLVAHTLAKSLETPHAGRLVEELMDSDEHCLVEIVAEPGSIGSALSAVRREHGGLVLALVRDGKVDLGIGADPVLADGDQLLLATQRDVTPGRG